MHKTLASEIMFCTWLRALSEAMSQDFPRSILRPNCAMLDRVDLMLST